MVLKAVIVCFPYLQQLNLVSSFSWWLEAVCILKANGVENESVININIL